MNKVDWEFWVMIGAPIIMGLIIIFGLGYLTYNDSQNAFQLQKICIERGGMFIANNCIFGGVK